MAVCFCLSASVSLELPNFFVNFTYGRSLFHSLNHVVFLLACITPRLAPVFNCLCDQNDQQCGWSDMSSVVVCNHCLHLDLSRTELAWHSDCSNGTADMPGISTGMCGGSYSQQSLLLSLHCDVTRTFTDISF